MQNDHAAAIGAAMVATITPTLIATSRREGVLDNDDAVLRAQAALSGSADRARHAASPSDPPSRTAAAADDGSGSSENASGDSDGADDGVVSVGAPLLESDIVLRAHVTVRFNAPRRAEAPRRTGAPSRRPCRATFASRSPTWMERPPRTTPSAKRECLLAARHCPLSADCRSVLARPRARVSRRSSLQSRLRLGTAPGGPRPCRLRLVGCVPPLSAPAVRALSRAPARLGLTWPLGSPAPLPSLSRRGGQVQLGVE